MPPLAQPARLSLPAFLSPARRTGIGSSSSRTRTRRPTPAAGATAPADPIVFGSLRSSSPLQSPPSTGFLAEPLPSCLTLNLHGHARSLPPLTSMATPASCLPRPPWPRPARLSCGSSAAEQGSRLGGGCGGEARRRGCQGCCCHRRGAGCGGGAEAAAAGGEAQAAAGRRGGEASGGWAAV
ncbi:hypothetical protein U9M48_010075 [Paspalum notatum var. saurae]|uniref:Uncharacterized protein n=1 Tax=Paspalum notatum var. saurae TaxID=547442 RepID=A0AAQ3WG59_PASNO